MMTNVQNFYSTRVDRCILFWSYLKYLTVNLGKFCLVSRIAETFVFHVILELSGYLLKRDRYRPFYDATFAYFVKMCFWDPVSRAGVITIDTAYKFRIKNNVTETSLYHG